MTLDRRLVIEALPAYDIGDEIGRGGWGVVLGARHRDLDRPVAIKQLPIAFAADPVVRARFKEEARMVARLDHPHIAPVYDFVEHEGLGLIVMEYLPGGSLWEKFQDEGVPFDAACGYILVASSALEHAHQRGILHRDVKPENFLFDDRPGVIKLSDFGIAKVLGAAAANLTAVGQIIGTPAYMAPEQILGKPVTPATDVYACGVMLFELLSGDLPFEETADPMQQIIAKAGQPPRDLGAMRPDVPAGIADVVMKAIESDPAARYVDATEFGEALATAATKHLGRGWLRRSGVELHGGGRLTAITERSAGDMTVSYEIARDPVRATTMHMRVGEIESEIAAALAIAKQTDDETPAATAPEAWHPDPLRRHEHRWWDGERWTSFASTGGVIVHDPLD